MMSLNGLPLRVFLYTRDVDLRHNSYWLTWALTLKLLFQPSLGFAALADWAVPVPARF